MNPRKLLLAFAILSMLPVTSYAEPQVHLETDQRLEQIAAAAEGTLGYCVMTVAGEVLFSRHADQSFPQASAIKIPILLEALAQRDAGLLDWHEQIPIRKAAQAGGTGVLAQLSDGGSKLSLEDLCVLMIVVSDNTATNILIDRVGMQNVTERMEALGCHDTKLRRVMMDTAAAERGEENVSTPADAARLMQLLARGEFLNRTASDEALAILRKPKSTAVRKAVPPEIPVATKPGAIPGIATEWALVEYAERPYVIAVMGKEGQETRFVQAFTEIAQCVHEFVTADKP